MGIDWINAKSAVFSVGGSPSVHVTEAKMMENHSRKWKYGYREMDDRPILQLPLKKMIPLAVAAIQKLRTVDLYFGLLSSLIVDEIFVAFQHGKKREMMVVIVSSPFDEGISLKECEF